MPKRLLILSALLLSTFAFADHLEIKRSAKLKSEPSNDSETLAQLVVGSLLPIIDDNQKNGYYHVIVPDSGKAGWVYRTFGRRSKDESGSGEGNFNTRSASLTIRAAAAKKRKSAACAPDLQSCPLYGCEEPNSDHALLNKLKRNQQLTASVVSLTFKEFRRLQSRTNQLHLPVGKGTELSEEDRALLGFTLSPGVKVKEGDLVQLVGYIAPERDLKPSGGESVNCRLPDADDNDVHIPIVEQSDGSEYDSIVVEPIPENRPKVWNVGTFKRLQENGTLLMIRGQLLFDNQHKVRDDPENEEGLTSEPKRFTTWEVHPIKELFECNRTGNACDPGKLEQWRQIK